MLLETEGIVLHSIRYGDKKVIVDMFTMQNGRQSFIATLAKGNKVTGMGKQLFQPLTILSITASPTRGQLHKITTAHVAVPYSSLPFDPFKLSISLFLAEFLYQSLKNEQANTPLYIYVKDSLLWLDVCDKSVSNFHLVFMLRLAQFIGFAPNTGGYCDGDIFDLRACSFCHAVPLHGDYLLPHEAAMIRSIVRINYVNMHLFRFTRAERNRLLDILVQYYCIHLPDFSQLRSLQVLRELF